MPVVPILAIHCGPLIFCKKKCESCKSFRFWFTAFRNQAHVPYVNTWQDIRRVSGIYWIFHFDCFLFVCLFFTFTGIAGMFIIVFVIILTLYLLYITIPDDVEWYGNNAQPFVVHQFGNLPEISLKIMWRYTCLLNGALTSEIIFIHATFQCFPERLKCSKEI